MSLPPIETVLFDYLLAANNARERTPSLLGDQLHANASSAGGCARAIGFRVSKTTASNPLTADSLVNFYIGDSIHDVIQRAIIARFPNAEAEVNGIIEDFITVRADVKYPAEDGDLVICEIKSTSDFGFKQATGAKLKSNGQWNKKDQIAEGPKREHILQTGISAKALGGKYLSIIYIRKTAAKDEPVSWEWRFRLEKYAEAIDTEIARLKRIVELARRGILPEREFNGEIILTPGKVRFPCGYCNFIDSCSKMEHGEVAISKTQDAPKSSQASPAKETT